MRYGRSLALPMSRAELGGMRLETLCRAFSKLKRLKIIQVNNTKVVILDRPHLIALSRSGNLRRPNR
jgi:hypothetical protein